MNIRSSLGGHPLALVRNIFALNQSNDYLRVSTFFIATAYLLLGVAYTFPNEFVRAAPAPGSPPRVNVVATIDSFTGEVPLWAAAFLVMSVALYASLWWMKYTVGIHLAGVVVTAMYCAASFAGAFFSPGTFVVAVIFSLFFGAQQWLTFDGVGAERDSIAQALAAEPNVGEGLVE